MKTDSILDSAARLPRQLFAPRWEAEAGSAGDTLLLAGAMAAASALGATVLLGRQGWISRGMGLALAGLAVAAILFAVTIPVARQLARVLFKAKHPHAWMDGLWLPAAVRIAAWIALVAGLVLGWGYALVFAPTMPPKPGVGGGSAEVRVLTPQQAEQRGRDRLVKAAEEQKKNPPGPLVPRYTFGSGGRGSGARGKGGGRGGGGGEDEGTEDHATVPDGYVPQTTEDNARYDVFRKENKGGNDFILGVLILPAPIVYGLTGWGGGGGSTSYEDQVLKSFHSVQKGQVLSVADLQKLLEQVPLEGLADWESSYRQVIARAVVQGPLTEEQGRQFAQNLGLASAQARQAKQKEWSETVEKLRKLVAAEAKAGRPPERVVRIVKDALPNRRYPSEEFRAEFSAALRLELGGNYDRYWAKLENLN